MRVVTAAALLVALVSGSGAAAAAEAEPVVRLGGLNRAATAAEVSEFGGATDTVVVARGDDFPDSLAVAPLAAALGAPVLLTATAYANAETIAEIERLGATEVVIVGGPYAVSVEAEATLERIAGVTTLRIYGRSRYETAAFVAHQIVSALDPAPGDRVAYLALGGAPAAWQPGTPMTGWPDAVSGGALAAAAGAPLLLTGGSALPLETAEAISSLGVTRVVIVGGEAAISPAVAETVAQLGVEVERVGGDDRYETSYLAASDAVAAGADPSRTIFATGRAWPDAVSGSALGGRVSAPMLLLDGQRFDARPTAGAFVDRFGVRQGIVLGGTTAVTPAVADDLADRILEVPAP